MNVRALRLGFYAGSVLLVLTVGASIGMAYITGYHYGAAVSTEAYVASARGLGAVLGAAILALAIVTQTVRAGRERLELVLLRWLDEKGEPIPDRWNPGVEMALEDWMQSIRIGDEGQRVSQMLANRKRHKTFEVFARRLFALPIALLTVIVALSLWSIPATETFLSMSFPELNTSLLFLTSYGTAVALGLLVVTMVLVLRTGGSTLWSLLPPTPRPVEEVLE